MKQVDQVSMSSFSLWSDLVQNNLSTQLLPSYSIRISLWYQPSPFLTKFYSVSFLTSQDTDTETHIVSDTDTDVDTDTETHIVSDTNTDVDTDIDITDTYPRYSSQLSCLSGTGDTTCFREPLHLLHSTRQEPNSIEGALSSTERVAIGQFHYYWLQISRDRVYFNQTIETIVALWWGLRTSYVKN